MQLINIPENIHSIRDLVKELKLNPERIHIFLFSSEDSIYTSPELSFLLKICRKSKKIETYYVDSGKNYDFIKNILKSQIIPIIVIYNFENIKMLVGFKTKNEIEEELNKKPHICYYCNKRSEKIREKVKCKISGLYMELTDNCYSFRPQ